MNNAVFVSAILVALCIIQNRLERDNALQGLWNVTESAVFEIKSLQQNCFKLQRESAQHCSFWSLETIDL